MTNRGFTPLAKGEKWESFDLSEGIDYRKENQTNPLS